MAPRSKRNQVNLFEDSPDENSSHVSSEGVDEPSGDLVKMNRSSSKKRSARTSSTKRIRMPVVSVSVLSTSKQNSMNESDLFGFTPEKSKYLKLLSVLRPYCNLLFLSLLLTRPQSEETE